LSRSLADRDGGLPLASTLWSGRELVVGCLLLLWLHLVHEQCRKDILDWGWALGERGVGGCSSELEDSFAASVSTVRHGEPWLG